MITLLCSSSSHYYEMCEAVELVVLSRSRQHSAQNYRTSKKPLSLSLFLSIQVGVTTTGAAHCLPSLRLCGPVVPAGTVWEAAALVLPHLPPPVQSSPPPQPGPSTATAWVVWEGWLEGAFVSAVPVPPHPRAGTSTRSIQMRKSLFSPLLLSPLTLSTFPILCSQATLCPGGTAGLYR